MATDVIRETLHGDRHRRCPIAIFDPDDRAYVASLYAVDNYEAADIRIALLDQFHGGLLNGSVVDAVFRAEGWLWPGEEEEPGCGFTMPLSPPDCDLRGVEPPWALFEQMAVDQFGISLNEARTWINELRRQYWTEMAVG